jgi:hypothetical protein
MAIEVLKVDLNTTPHRGSNKASRARLEPDASLAIAKLTPDDISLLRFGDC